jgi:SAM-dependent methyltransferase
MKKIKNEVYLDFLGKVENRTLKVSFKNKVSKSTLFISKKTGTLFHSPNESTESSLKEWSQKIFSKKIDTSKIKYTSENPIMKSRHYYSALFLNQHLKRNKKIMLCDFGAGEGNFAKELIRVNNRIVYNFTEHSPKLFRKTKKIIEKNSKNNFKSYNGSIEGIDNLKKFNNFDCASLLWTLCNCINPLEVLRVINKSLKKNGLLIVSESSRILVPFKKPIDNFFVSEFETRNTHPWFFSYNSLSNLLEISGFRIISKNRFYDENDLVVVAKKMNEKKHKPKIIIDDSRKVLNFLKDWEKFTYLYLK